MLERDAAKCARARAPSCPDVPGHRRRRHAPGRPTRRAVAAAVDAFGGLDVLVNCVGVFDFYRSITDLDADLLDDAFDEMFRANVQEPPARRCKAALPALRARAAASCC